MRILAVSGQSVTPAQSYQRQLLLRAGRRILRDGPLGSSKQSSLEAIPLYTSFRHEGVHVMGIVQDGPDIVGQTQDPNGPNYMNPTGAKFKATVMNANPWQLNAEDAGYYCDFWATRDGF